MTSMSFKNDGWVGEIDYGIFYDHYFAHHHVLFSYTAYCGNNSGTQEARVDILHKKIILRFHDGSVLFLEC